MEMLELNTTAEMKNAYGLIGELGPTQGKNQYRTLEITHTEPRRVQPKRLALWATRI